jgi:hypothetical protein
MSARSEMQNRYTWSFDAWYRLILLVPASLFQIPA